MRILLLGATGLLGNNVLQQLLEAGHEVTALVRRKGGIVAEAAKGSNQLNIIEGDILKWEDLKAAAEGAGALVNCAGQTDMTLTRLEDYRPVNRDLCALIARLRDEQTLEAVVHVSTANTVGNVSPGHFADETLPPNAPFGDSLYARSKMEGETLLLEASRHGHGRIVVLNPGFILGPYDARPGSGRLLLAAHGRRLMVAPAGGKAFVAASDVAKAVLAALERGRNGERYLVVGECMGFKELYELQAEVCGYRQTVVGLWRWFSKAAGLLGDAARTLGIRTELCSSNVAMMMAKEYYSNRKMRDELGVQPLATAEAIRQFYQWRASR